VAPLEVRVHLALIAAQVAFASLAIAGKIVMHTIAPSAVAVLRLGGAAVVFAAVLARRGELPRLPWRDLAGIAGCATLGMFLNQIVFLHGLQLTSPVNATVLVSTTPVLAVVVAILLGREPARTRTLAGVVVAFAGVLWLVGGDLAIGGDTAQGDLLVLANSFAYSLYLVLVRDYIARYGTVVVVAIGFSFAALLALPVGLPTLIAEAPEIEPATWALALYVVVVATVLPYFANAWALHRAPTSFVAIYIYAQPLIAIVLSWLFLDETPTARIYGTIAAVFTGIWLVTRPSRRERSESYPPPPDLRSESVAAHDRDHDHGRSSTRSE
jgi:drug/metabolite transporter (DMT)-like permease